MRARYFDPRQSKKLQEGFLQPEHCERVRQIVHAQEMMRFSEALSRARCQCLGVGPEADGLVVIVGANRPLCAPLATIST